MDLRSPGRPPAEDGGRHRGQSYRPIRPPGFWSDFQNVRELPLVLGAGVVAVGWGTEITLSGNANALTRLAGVASVVGGTLILVSYFLYFKPGSLATPAWQQVPSRRRFVFVIRHLWLGVFVILVATWLADWIGTR